MRAALIVLAALAVTGCAGSPAYAPTEAPLPTPTVSAVPEETAAPYDEAAFVEALRGHLRAENALDVPEVREALIGSGRAACGAWDGGDGFESVLIVAEREFSDRSVYGPGMPGAFALAAGEHLCGGGR